MTRALVEYMEIVVEEHELRSVCLPPADWYDADTSDHYVAAVTKDGMWVVVTRVSRGRGEVVRFEIPREIFLQCAKHMGLHS